jgi:hypothetical protein
MSYVIHTGFVGYHLLECAFMNDYDKATPRVVHHESYRKTITVQFSIGKKHGLYKVVCSDRLTFSIRKGTREIRKTNSLKNALLYLKEIPNIS